MSGLIAIELSLKLLEVHVNYVGGAVLSFNSSWATGKLQASTRDIHVSDAIKEPLITKGF